jgi:hypothetical protein
MAIADYRDILLVAGQDPYGYKGVIDDARALVRRDGTGGCKPVVEEPAVGPEA